MTCLLAAAETLVNLRESWSGTLIILFQPAEERGTGAKAMVEDGHGYASGKRRAESRNNHGRV
jgi:metal-dependent amidase/aminoacylase/carboxypeptidase family protein